MDDGLPPGRRPTSCPMVSCPGRAAMGPSSSVPQFPPFAGDEDRFSIRVGDHYRALGRQADEKTIWVWTGTHSDYDRATWFQRMVPTWSSAFDSRHPEQTVCACPVT